MPSESQVGSTVSPGAGRHQELRHHRLVGGAAGRHQVAVGVPGAGAERLRALDVEAAVDRLVRRWSAGTAATPAPRSLIATAYQAPSAAAREQPVPGGEDASSGTPSASASSSVTAPSAPVTEACMLNTSAVAPLPRASS